MFPQAMVELRNPLSHNFVFPQTRGLIAAIVLACSSGISERHLNAKLESFEHRQDYQSLPSLSNLQVQTVQGFVRSVYGVRMALVAMMGRSSRAASGGNARAGELLREMRHGSQPAAICMQAYAEEMLRANEENASSVVTREELPCVWREVVLCLTVVLCDQMEMM